MNKRNKENFRTGSRKNRPKTGLNLMEKLRTTAAPESTTTQFE